MCTENSLVTHFCKSVPAQNFPIHICMVPVTIAFLVLIIDGMMQLICSTSHIGMKILEAKASLDVIYCRPSLKI